MTLRLLLGLTGAVLTVASCRTSARDAVADASNCTTITAQNIDDCVRLNQIQVLGTHNSYHIAPPAPVRPHLQDGGKNVEYTHRPLIQQLTELGIRQFELDVFADPEGGRYARPAALPLLREPQMSPVLAKRGFKVLHTQDVDYLTTCLTLIDCLTIIRDWSRANPRHVPIQIQIEAKDQKPDDTPTIKYVTPAPVDAAEFRALDAEIRSVFSADHLITPDMVRGAQPTLAEAIKTTGWPLLRAARGKILFVLDNTDHHKTSYLDGNSSLEGRVLFVSAEPGEAAAAFIKMNEALGADETRIRDRVREGFLIRTRADIPTAEARSGDTTRRDAAFRSGAHYVSTDYPEPSPFGSGYVARLPGAERLTARCNPVNAPAGCRDEWLEGAASRRDR